MVPDVDERHQRAVHRAVRGEALVEEQLPLAGGEDAFRNRIDAPMFVKSP